MAEQKEKMKAEAPLLRPEQIVDLFAQYGKKLTEMDHPANDAVLYFQQGGRCIKTANEANLADIKYDDLLDCTDFSIPEKDWLLGQKTMRVMIQACPTYIGLCLAIQRPIEPVLEDMAMIIGQNVLIAPRDKKSIGKALRSRYAVMVEDKHVLVTGRTFYEAYTALLVLEKAAELMLKADVLGGGIPVSARLASMEHRVYTTKYSQKAGASIEHEAQAAAAFKNADAPAQAEVQKPADMSEDEWQKRCLLIEYGKKVLNSGLVQGTWGNLSIRLDDEYMVVTPSGLDYNTLSPLDEVKVELKTGEYEGDLKPTSETAIHRGLYLLRPEMNSVIHTHAKYCAVFASAHMPLEIEDPAIAEEFGTDMLPVANYGMSGSQKLADNIMKVMKNADGCIMRNHGMLAIGADIEQAFDRCLKMEQAATANVERRWQKLLEEEPAEA